MLVLVLNSEMRLQSELFVTDLNSLRLLCVPVESSRLFPHYSGQASPCVPT
jgi:hypothetical protein